MLVLTAFLGAASLAAVVYGQAYEPADFDVSAALEDLGVNVTEIPELAGLEKRSSKLACSIACSALSALYRGDTVLDDDDQGYSAFNGGFWSLQQSSVSPQCIFKPSLKEDVSVAVLLSRLTQCPFAVKSGGHAAFTGASNIEGGITISLERMKAVKLSSDKKTVVVQPGNRWSDVYKVLDQQDVTVAGGRVASVGTGGLTLGGGISFFSNIYGWSCDNVVKYEVVTAAGLIVEASEKSNPQLYWALRGGGNNFGIVTAFTHATIPLPGGKMWGGDRIYLENSFEEVTDAFAGVVANSPKDPNAGLWVAWLNNQGTKLASTELWYAKPDGGNAEIFDDFNAITSISDTTKNQVLYDYTKSLNEGNPYGLREVYYGLTVKANPKIAHLARQIFFEELPSTSGINGANPVLIFQGITEGQLKHMSQRGGNALGLDVADGPLYLIHIAAMWLNESDDKTMYTFISKVLTRIETEAKKLKVENDYIYMNYASPFEDVIANYGPANVAKLKKIASLYDPTQVFQRLQPGHFKLDGAPIKNSPYWSGLRK